MSSTTHDGTEIETIVFKRRFLLAYGVHQLQASFSGYGYWNHSLGLWLLEAKDATTFDTQAGALVYRRGNLLRMQLAMNSHEV
ncbi:MAG: hypothetical protein JWP89_5979 [Schlesneria sp.]|nr:hypothetical protein [Schlesneria sp.]